jgi:murein DD-endopeptidase MepM/ murein hydrolase activator NlpD
MPGVSSSIPPADQSVLHAPPIPDTHRVEPAIPQAQLAVKEQLDAAQATPTAEPVVAPPQDDAFIRAAAAPTKAPRKQYDIYTVVEGDTVSSIAARLGLSPDTIVANNAEVQSNENLLVLGQSLIVPSEDGILHEVRYGDTLSDIAARYDVPLEAITSFQPNNLPTVDSLIKDSQLVFVPGGKQRSALPVPTTLPSAGATPAPSSDDSPASASRLVRGGASSAEGLIWPVVGPISSPYGPSHPLGIDVDGYNLVGAPIGAATSGTVIFAGGNACCSYGLYVVVLSPSGIETLYAHLSSISVVQGQTVEQGEQLGVIGSTGYSTGVHLHFEVIDNGVRQNPVNYLP